MALDVTELLTMSDAQLDDLFTNSPAGPIPNGPAKGTAIVAPGTIFSKDIAEAVSLFVWEGKSFDGVHGTLVNRISALSVNAIIAEVYKGNSWFDKKECIVLDYSKTSTIASWIRDEIRLVAPDLYLGIVYGEQKKLIHFALEFPQA